MLRRNANALLLPLLLLLLLLQLSSLQADNILAVFGYAFSSPYLLVTPYINALVAKGHRVTLLTASKHMPLLPGVQHIRISSLDRQMEELKENPILDVDFSSKWAVASVIAEWYFNSSQHILSDAGVQSLLQDTQAHYDMVIVQAALTDALYGFAQHFNASLVGISAFGTAWNIDYLSGNKAPSIYEPMSSEGYSHAGQGFYERLKNWIFISEEWLLERFVYLPAQLQLYKRYFNRSAEQLYSIRRNFSLMLVNQHFSLGRAKSNGPNVIEVAGMHMNQPEKQLPESLQRFVEQAPHGVILLSMGIHATESCLPPNLSTTLAQSLAQLKQRVVWRTELSSLPNMSSNIYLMQQLPQRELLAHPNVKLFITHGGVLSIIEAAYSAVPMLCLPLYYDQFANAERMRHAGVALVGDALQLTVESLRADVEQLLQNPRYQQNANELSRRLQDQPMSPLDNAVWWTEYVLRHKGAPHMRLSEQDMSFMQYYSLDIFSVLLGRIGLAILIVTCVGLKLGSFLLNRLHFRLSVPAHI
ncbi:Ugt86Dh [Drosophila busckii]|uniref:Ugt86Dh n=1 Tax=Drosophila busckii TaxID=30019 RepID=A0A0M4F3A8_DROBS|nr:UDP-glucuronosyltransferase 2B15 [Drosophila busckii]ALC45682.1 Ugt86Dh [Drosophila busckii]